MELRRRAWQLFFFALAIRLGWLGLLLLSPNRRIAASDSAFYDEVAWNLANGNGFFVDGSPTAFHPPGYPLVLAGIYWVAGHSQGAAQVVGVVLSASVPVLAVMLTVKLGLGPRVALVGGMILAIYPSQVFYSTFIGGEAITSVLLIGAAIITTSRQYLIAAVLLGLAALTRSFALGFLPLIVAAFLVEGRGASITRRAGTCALIVACAVAPLVPWAARNNAAMGKPIITTTSDGYSLWAGHSHGASGYYRPIPKTVRLPADEVERDEELRRLAFEFMREEPLQELVLVPRKLYYLFVPEISGLSFNRFENPSRAMDLLRIPLSVIAELFNAGVLMLAAFAVPTIWRRHRRAAWMLLAPAILFVCAVVATHAENRYRAPVAWLFVIPAAYAVGELQRVFGQRRGAEVRAVEGI